MFTKVTAGLALVLVALAATALPARATPSPENALPARCGVLIDQVAAATAAPVDHRSYSGQFAVLFHRDLEELAVSCPHGDRDVSVEGTLQSAYPRPGFFATLATAGAVLVGEPALVVEAALRRCYRDALHDDDEVGTVDGGSFHVECQAYLREDGNMMMVITRAADPATLPARYPRAPAPTHGARIGPVE